MKNKIIFAFALITTGLLHSYVLNSVKLKQHAIAVEPQKKVSPIINLQRVAIKKPEPIVQPVIEEVLPEPPEPVAEEVVVVPLKKIKKKAIEKIIKKKVAKKKLIKKKKVVKTKKSSKPKRVAKMSSKAQLSSPKQKAIKDHYLSKVRRMIEQRKKYPHAAKRLRQQGVVYVKFMISQDGTIRHIGLVKKSRHEKLDKAALNILKKIGAFAPIPKELGERYLSVTVPIKYKILN